MRFSSSLTDREPSMRNHSITAAASQRSDAAGEPASTRRVWFPFRLRCTPFLGSGMHDPSILDRPPGVFTPPVPRRGKAPIHSGRPSSPAAFCPTGQNDVTESVSLFRAAHEMGMVALDELAVHLALL